MKIRTIDDASTRIEAADITPAYRTKLLRFVLSLLNAPSDSGISMDELCDDSGAAA